MARYQFRRPSPIHVYVTREKRQEAGLGAMGPGSEDDPRSPDSPACSPSTTSAPSPGDCLGVDHDEPPSPKEKTTSIESSQASSTSSPNSSTASISSISSSSRTPMSSSQRATTPTQISMSTIRSISSPASTQTSSSRGISAVAPQPTAIASPTPASFSTSSSTTSTTQLLSSKIARPTQPSITTASLLPLQPSSGVTGSPAEENDTPRRTRPEPTLMSKGAEAAAITLSIFGAIALIVAILFYCKRRRRRRHDKREAEDALDAANHAALRTPQMAYIKDDIVPSAGPAPHMTQYSDRSNTLFGPGSYFRPETVSTSCNQSRISMPQPTPNPFADPPLNKAYDVLAGRPRSTTLTDRGSWIKNPFKDPESGRFDPFGELQAKARRARAKQIEIAKREAELERQFEEKENMGLVSPKRAMDRKGSNVTLEGLGVLTRSGGGTYR